jgi:hypothetical protein
VAVDDYPDAPSPNATLPAVLRMVNEVQSDDSAVHARCKVALQLASALDDAVAAGSGAAQMAVSSLSKELRLAISDIASLEGRKEAFRASIFNDEV